MQIDHCFLIFFCNFLHIFPSPEKEIIHFFSSSSLFILTCFKGLIRSTSSPEIKRHSYPIWPGSRLPGHTRASPVDPMDPTRR